MPGSACTHASRAAPCYCTASAAPTVTNGFSTTPPSGSMHRVRSSYAGHRACLGSCSTTLRGGCVMGPRTFMDQVRMAMRSAELSYRTEQSYCAVICRFILFHGRRHPAEMGAAEVATYLTALAEEQHISASTQHVALCALTFLYRVVLAQPLPLDLVFVRAAPSTRLPV